MSRPPSKALRLARDQAPAANGSADRGERIVAVAAAIFAREGYRNTDIQDVADALGIGKGSIYRRFPSKQDLFLAAVDSGMSELRDRVHAAADAETDPLEQIRAAVRAYLGFIAEHPQFAELLIQERAEFRDRKESTYFAHRDSHIRRWRRLYGDLMRAGRIRSMPVDRITDVLSNLLYGTMFTNAIAGSGKSAEAQARDILDVVFLGILGRNDGGRNGGGRSGGAPRTGGQAPARRRSAARAAGGRKKP